MSIFSIFRRLIVGSQFLKFGKLSLIRLTPRELILLYLSVGCSLVAANPGDMPMLWGIPNNAGSYYTHKEACVNTGAYLAGWWIYGDAISNSTGLCAGGPTDIAIAAGYDPATNYGWAAVINYCPSGYSLVSSNGFGYCQIQSTTTIPKVVPEKK